LRYLVLVPLVGCLFAVSFWESWSALTDAAVDAQIPHPGPWPLAVDGFIVVSALLVVEARRTGHVKGAWWPRLGLLGATALSTAIQALYAPEADWAWTLHAWSPLAVLASFECLVWLVFSDFRPVWILPDQPPPPPPDPEPDPEPDQDQTRPGVTPQRQRRPRPAAPGRPTLTKADQQALDRAQKDPAEVERIMVRRGLDRSAVAARPERWPLPSENGTKVGAS
jgi:hypothetical protein